MCQFVGFSLSHAEVELDNLPRKWCANSSARVLQYMERRENDVKSVYR